MRIIITGLAGFAGRHLAGYLIKAHQEKYCHENENNSKVCKGKQNPEIALQITGLDIIPDINGDAFLKSVPDAGADKGRSLVDYINADIKDSSITDKIISRILPDRIYHLAAQSSVSYSWQNPRSTFEDNVFPAINIFESVKKYCPQCRVLVTCTAEEYDYTGNDGGKNSNAVTEDSKIRPSNPYAVSKAALDYLTTVYQKAFGLNLYITRAFNHTGPGQSERFVASDFAKQIADIELKKSQPVIKVGNINACRDFLDVRDVVMAYWMITEKAAPGTIYNVCSGKMIAISEILDNLISLSSRKDIEIVLDKNKIRPVDSVYVYGDNTRLVNDTGWKPCIDIKKSLEDTLNWWRERSK